MTDPKFYMTKKRTFILSLLLELPPLMLFISAMLPVFFAFSQIFQRVIDENTTLYEAEFIKPYDSDLRVSFLLIVPYVTFLLIRYTVKKRWLSALIHFLVSVLMALLTFVLKSIEIQLLIIALILILGYSLIAVFYPPDASKSIAEQKKTRLLSVAIINIILTFAMSFSEDFEYMPFLAASSVVSVLSAIGYLHIQRLNESLDKLSAKLVDKSLAHKTIRFNNILIVAAVGAVSVASLLCFLPDYSEIGSAHWIIESAPWKPSDYKIKPTVKPLEFTSAAREEDRQDLVDDVTFIPTRLQMKWMPPTILFGITGVIIFFFIIFSIYKLYQRIKQSKKTQSSAIELYTERTTGDTGEPPFKLPKLFRSPNEQIRRMFFLKVKEYVPKGLTLLSSSTSVSIASDIEKEEDINLLENYYERARYSGGELTKDDIKTLKRHNRQNNPVSK